MSALVASFVLTSAALASPLANPSVVTPTGQSTSVIRVPAPGMYSIRVETDVDVNCELSDALRGTFLTRTKTCMIAELLDPGVYKLTTSFPASSKSQSGRAKVDVNAFVEDEVSPVKLEDGAGIEAILLEGHQRSFWLDIPSRQHLAFTIAGRTVGQVNLWREGEWTERGRLTNTRVSVGGGRQVHRWEFSGTLEAGRYKVVAAGANPVVWTTAETRTRQNRLAVAQREDALFISRGAPAADASGAFPFTLPAWGFTRFAVPYPRAAAALELASPTKDKVSLRAVATSRDAITFKGGSSCSIYKSSTLPMCGVSGVYGRDLVILEVQGPPGTKGTVRAAPLKDKRMGDGIALSMSDTIAFRGPSDATAKTGYLVGSFDLPPDDDAAPLACVLEELSSTGRVRSVVATDAPHLSSIVGLERRFNYNHRTGAEVWFHLDSADTFAVNTTGKLGSQCELFAFDESGKSTRVASGAKQRSRVSKRTNTCALSKFLSPGRYLLRLYNGRRGVETIRIATSSTKLTTPGQSACRLENVPLQRNARYRLRHSRRGRAPARGLILRKLPITLEKGMAITVSSDDPLVLPFEKAEQVRVRSVGNVFECGVGDRLKRSQNGVCTTRVSPGSPLKITTNSQRTLSMHLERDSSGSARRLKGPSRFSPRQSPPLPRLNADREVFFDFEVGQERAFALNVPRAGLYELETTGLLAMECSVRTPTVFKVYSDAKGGRGRNCLLQGGLRPGEYLLKVKALGASRGRAGVILRQRKPNVGPVLNVGDQRHTDIAPGTLLVTPVNVGKEDANQPLQFRAAAAGGRTGSCRLEDDDGWPVQSAPHNCVFSRTLPEGRYRWVQLPTPMQTTREMSVVRPPAVVTLAPKKSDVTSLRLNNLVNVSLGDEKEQTFRFVIPADLDVKVSIDNGMRGTIFQRRADGSRGSEVATVGPLILRGALSGAPFQNGAVFRQALKAGDYLFAVRHSRDDVGITYRVGVAVQSLAPGVSLVVPSSSTLDVVNPEDGYVRIRTEGATDVRCRLFDVKDRLIAESSSSGADWNCGLVQQLLAGRYRLVLETETGRQNTTTVSMVRPKNRDLGSVTSGTRLTPKDSTLRLFLAPTAGDVVEDIVLTSDAPLSCALEESDGRVLSQQLNQTQCRLLVWAGPRPKAGNRAGLFVRLWQTASSAGVRYTRTTRSVRAFSGGTLRPNTAGLAVIQNGGRYKTGPNLACLPGQTRGVLRDCSTIASLDKGPHIVAGLSSKSTPVALAEVVRQQPRSTADVLLSGRPFIERHQSSQAALHLARVRTRPGAGLAPVCQMRGGVSRIDADTCIGAIARRQRSTLTAFAATTTPLRASVLRRTVSVPSPSPLPRGAASVGWTGDATAYTLPKLSYRAQVTLAAGAWAVTTDARGRTLDVCHTPAPATPDRSGGFTLTSCTLRGKGGNLVLVSAGGAKAGKARIQLVTTTGPARQTLTLRPMQEVTPSSPATQRFTIEKAATVQQVHVEGNGTFACELLRDDGIRESGCHLQVPAGLGATLSVEHDGQPFRARAHRNGWDHVARFGRRLPKALGPSLSLGDVVPLGAGLTDRTISVSKRSVLRIHADSGVCALFSGRKTLAVSGLGGPCEISTVVAPGPHRVMVRPFASQKPHGELFVVTADVTRLTEGVGESAWVTPGEERFFRFDVKSDAKVGIGLQATSDLVTCTLYDRYHRAIGQGCQQYASLAKGGYELGVFAPPGGPPLAVKPVVLGTEGTAAAVPADVIEEFLSRAEVTQ